ncbi:MAG: DUF1338 domain-containing protein [Halomonas sp.]|uniref:DUF1338 family protein n=1 Tax=Halomonas sp. TaxID=1486246 RepID=UPI0017CBDB76|nr:DUF1338 family protein [Halomonas sp.]NWN82751.1 DUF1338 domain-containing protein [Halomonas sp.]
MQRAEFIQQLWLDFIHQHPKIGGLRLWAPNAPAEYLALLTLNHSDHGMDALLPSLEHFGYRIRHRHAMADRGLLVNLLSPLQEGPWFAVAELQTGTLPRHARALLENLVDLAPQSAHRGPNRLCRGRPWPMPDWDSYQTLYQAHPLAAALAINGPRLHHVGYDCQRLGTALEDLHRGMEDAGFAGTADRQHGLFPISPLIQYRFYPGGSHPLPFAEGDEHRVETGGVALVQKSVGADQERAVELLLPHHTRCEIN